MFEKKESVALVTATKRTFWVTNCGHITNDYENPTCRCGAIRNFLRSSEKSATLVSSLCENGLHAPALDIDMPTTLEKTTDGKLLLKTDARMSWKNYSGLIAELRNLGLSSECHASGILLDCPARLFPSTTKGHFHLYLDVCLNWEHYAHLLLALEKANIIEKKFFELSVAQGQTRLRPPGVRKENYRPSY
ncbi:MAG: hypothetical protein Q8P49_03900 [Candidatus Liptonbacteria bacterium]|nr:hypothetical protein [Candidatus Liptonbacteria bacterium]